MTKPQWSRLISAGGAILIVASLLVGFLPGPTASAATVDYTAQASGRGLRLALAGNSLGDDQLAPRSADTDRDPPGGDGIVDCVEATSPTECRQGPGVGTYPNLPILANILSAGVIAQDAAVDDIGNSKACAGIIGPGGLLTIDETPQPCLGADPTNPGGIVVNLVDGIPLGLLRLRVDGIYAECEAHAGDPQAIPPIPATASGVGRVANIVVDTLVPLVGWFPLLTIPVGGAPNSHPLFPADSALAPLNALVSLTVNEQIPAPPLGPDTRTQIEVAALHLTVLGVAPGGGLLDVRAGIVSCGTNTAVINGGTTTTTASTTSTTVDGSTTTSSSTTSTTVDGSTTTSSSTTSTSVDPGSTTTSSTTSTTLDTDPIDPGEPGETTTSTTTAPEATTTSTTVASGAATSSTSSTAAPAATAGTGTKAALAKSGVNTRTQLAMALGLLGLGMVVTGRGLQLGFDGPDRRRR